MAVFTRPAARSELTTTDFDFVGDDVPVLTALLRNAVARKEPGVNVLLYGPPGTGKTELAKVGGAGRRARALRGGVRRPRRQLAVRAATATARCRSARCSSRAAPSVALLFDEVEDVFPPISTDAAQLMARLDSSDARAHRQRQRQGLGQPDPRDQPGAGDLGHQPHRADRPGVPPPLPVPPRAEEPAARRARGAGDARAGRRRRWARGFAARLAERRGLTPAQIRTAVRFARPGRRRDCSDSAEALIERQLGNADKALGNAQQPSAARAAW